MVGQSWICSSAAFWRPLSTKSGYEPFNNVFGIENFVANIIWQKKYSPANDAQWFSDDHDYVLLAANNKELWRPEKLPRSEVQNKLYQNPDNDERGAWMSGDYTSNKSAEERPNTYYAITHPHTGKEIWPSRSSVWRYTKAQHEKNVEDKRVWWGIKGENAMPRFKRFLSEVGGVVPRTIWPHGEVGHNQDAVRELQSLFGTNPFASPKPTKLIQRILQLAPGDVALDFFAGSGTLGHTVINRKRDSGESQNFLLVEMGEYFDPVLMPRIQKVMYCPTWRDGKPAETTEFPLSGVTPDWVERSPRLVKVLRLESFEDSLNALELPQEQSARAKGLQDIFGKDYLLKYLLPTEVEDTSEVFLNTERLERPFDYKLRIHTPEGPKEQPVDLIETFNLLMGYHVKRMFGLTGERAYTCVEAQSDEGPVLVLWRDLKDLDPATERAFLEGALTIGNYAKIYVNGDSALPGAESLDAEFKNRLLARAVGILA